MHAPTRQPPAGQFIQAKFGEDGKPGFFAIASPPGADKENGRLWDGCAEAAVVGSALPPCAWQPASQPASQPPSPEASRCLPAHRTNCCVLPPPPAGVVELLVKAQGGAAEQLCGAAAGAELLVSAPMGKGFPVDAIPPADCPTVLIFATGSGARSRRFRASVLPGRGGSPVRTAPPSRARLAGSHAGMQASTLALQLAPSPPARAPLTCHPTPHRATGISPIKALIESGALQAGQRKDVRLYYGARSPQHMAFASAVPAWEAAGVRVIPVYSEQGGGYVQDAFAKVGPAWGVAVGRCGQACGAWGRWGRSGGACAMVGPGGGPGGT